MLINILISLACLCIGAVLGLLASKTGMAAWFMSLFSEDSRASFGRVGAFIALIASIVWVTWLVYKNSALPDLSGICFFIGTLYGLSKGIAAVQAIKGDSNVNPPSA